MSRKPARRKQRATRRARRGTAGRPGPLDAMLREAVSLQQAGRLAEAEGLYREVLRQAPDHPAALQYLAWIANRAGRAEEAIALIRRSLEHTPRDPVAQSNLGNILREQGRLPEAIEAYRAAIRLRPDYVNAHYNLGITLRDNRDHERAARHFRRAIDLAPRDAVLWDGLGTALGGLRQLDEAKRAFETAIRLDPAYAEAYSQLGVLSMVLGKQDEARAYFDKVLELEPEHANTHLMRSRLREFEADDEGELARMEAMLERAGDDEEALISLHFGLGKMYDDIGEVDKAFAHFESANRLRSRTANFDVDGLADEVARTIATFTPERTCRRRPTAKGSDLPVFIVGMPRSGTTLVEQIIASHPSAAGAGELRDIDDLTKVLAKETGRPYPECVEDLTPGLADTLAARYLARLRAVGPGAVRVTDKALSHAFHLGFIALLFPDARIVVCNRDPLDVGLSLFFQKFVPGTLEFSYDLGSIGVYCREHRRLMRHWREVLPLELHEVSYEDLVANQERVSRGIIEYCGLPWDDRCLSFFETERAVHTASHWQVRQPIYRSSVGRAARYSSHLDALRRGLAAGDV